MCWFVINYCCEEGRSVRFVCLAYIAKHLQKSVPVKATSVRAGGGGTSATQHKPAQQNHVVPGTSAAVTTPQRPPSGASSTPQLVVNRPPAVSSSSHPAHEQLLRHELQKLQKEKERLRREQEEAVRKVSFPLIPSTPAVPNCCCSKGSAPYWSNPLFLIFDIWALWCCAQLTLGMLLHYLGKLTSSSAMAERLRKLDNDFRGVNLRLNYRLKGYFSRHCDMTQITLTHHIVNKPFLLLGVAAEYRCRRWCDQHYGWPSDVYDTDRRTKLTVLKMISRWLLLKKNKKNSSLSPPLGHLGVTYALYLWLVAKTVVDFILLVISYGWDVMSGNRSKVGVFAGGWSHWAQISEGRGHRPPTIVGVRKLEWLPFRVVLIYPQCII